jgi:hypothetical protein
VTRLLLLLALASEPPEEVELSSAPVTALSCAQKAVKTGKLELITTCPMEETKKGLVVVDVAEKQIYRLSKKSVRRSDLDVTGVVKSTDKKDGIPEVEVKEYRVTPRPKPGSFKGCL